MPHTRIDDIKLLDGPAWQSPTLSWNQGETYFLIWQGIPNHDSTPGQIAALVNHGPGKEPTLYAYRVPTSSLSIMARLREFALAIIQGDGFAAITHEFVKWEDRINV